MSISITTLRGLSLLCARLRWATTSMPAWPCAAVRAWGLQLHNIPNIRGAHNVKALPFQQISQSCTLRNSSQAWLHGHVAAQPAVT